MVNDKAYPGMSENEYSNARHDIRIYALDKPKFHL